MMSRFFRNCVVCFVITFSLSAFAQIKIAAVSVTDAIFGTEEGTAVQETWLEEYQPEIDRLSKLQDEIRALNERYRTDVDILTVNEKTALELDIDSKTKRFQNGQEQLNTDRTTKAQLYFQQQFPLFETVLNDIIEIEGYDAVFRLDNNVQVFLHLNSKHIITAKVIEELNERMEQGLPEELTDVEESDEDTEEGSTDESAEGGE